MSGQKSTHVSKEKKKIVEELTNLIKTKKTVLIASIKNLPASQFQEICKKLRGKAIVKVPKKNLIFRSLDSSGNEAVKKLEEVIKADVAVLFSDLDVFELSGELLDSKTPAKAKPGQEAPEDIIVQPGPTDLLPGPAVSELGAVGIPIEIKQGKISIKQQKTIVKKGEKISMAAADVMSKLDIKPFSIGFIPLAGFDNVKGKLYAEISIDKEGTIAELKEAYSRALPFAVEIGYASKDTIGFLLSKAEIQAKALEKLQPVEAPKEEEKKEENAEEKPEPANEGEGDNKTTETESNDKPTDIDKSQSQTPSESKKQTEQKESQNQTPEDKTEEKSSGEENK